MTGDEFGSATDIDRLLVSLGLSTPVSTLVRRDDLRSCHPDLRPKMSPKNGKFEFGGYLGVIESDCVKLFGPAYALLCHGQCSQFSSSNLQWLTKFDFKLYPRFTLAQLVPHPRVCFYNVPFERALTALRMGTYGLRRGHGHSPQTETTERNIRNELMWIPGPIP